MQSVHPPKEELEFQLQREIPVNNPPKARPADIISRWLNDNVFDPTAEALRVTLNSASGDPIYLDGELTNDPTRYGNLIGAIKSDDTFHALKMTDADRLMVDAELSLQDIDLEVNLDAANDSVAIKDRVTGNLLKVEDDGSINANVAVSGILDDDSILIVGTTTGELSGDRKIAKIKDTHLYVLDEENKTINEEINDKTGAALVTSSFDEINLSYVQYGNGKGQLQEATYKYNNNIVATIQLEYNSDDRLVTVRKA